MGDKTAISWTDKTFNPWWGCTKIAPGCDNCYAQVLDHRTGGDFWNDPPRTMSQANWNKPLKWNDEILTEPVSPGRHLVFCGSMCDVFDKNAPDGQRDRLWELIRQTPNLTWQLLTKRAPNIEKYLPDDWGSGYENVWLGVTVEDQEHGWPRMRILRAIPAKLRFVSCEPLLEYISFAGFRPSYIAKFGWVIAGGESGKNHREVRRSWIHDIRKGCVDFEIPFFFKQWNATVAWKADHTINGELVHEFPPQIG